jgi:hypothetical protein
LRCEFEIAKKKKEALNEKAMDLATKVYQEAAKKEQEASANNTEKTEDNKKDDVINADFEEKE